MADAGIGLHKANPGPDVTERIPEVLAAELRRLAHDLSNALEIVVQTSYLLGTTGIQEPAAEWLRMLDGGVEKALGINGKLRAYVKDHSDR